jgi:hypothetical protein
MPVAINPVCAWETSLDSIGFGIIFEIPVVITHMDFPNAQGMLNRVVYISFYLVFA